MLSQSYRALRETIRDEKVFAGEEPRERRGLTMTTGLDDGVADKDCTEKPCLVYKADAGTRWAYHNAPYTLLDNVMTGATGNDLNAFVNEELETKIGMEGTFIKSGFNNVFYSTARSMARYGLLLLNKGK